MSRLLIPSEVEAKLHAYVRAVETEIAGMGKAVITEDGDVLMTDVAIYEQQVTGGTADLSSEALAKFQTELIQNGESPKDWIVWWHSHADMSAFFSGTDTTTIDGSSEFNHLVSLVVNRRRERKARIDVYHPFRFTKDNLVIVVGVDEFVVPEDIQAEVNEKVTVKTTYSPWKGGYGRGAGYHDKDADGGKGSAASSYEDYVAASGGARSTREIIDTTKSIFPKSSQPTREDMLNYIDIIEESIKEKLNEKGMTQTSPEVLELQDQLHDWDDALVQYDYEHGLIDVPGRFLGDGSK